jgi:hypothetical protein
MTGAISRLRRALAGLAAEQRRVALAALLVLASMLLPWYSKSTSAITKGGLASAHESKMAILVPSFVEASIFLVAIAVLALMFFRGEGRAFHLPFGDGIVCTAAGAWVAFLVFYRFVDQPAGGSSPAKNLQYTYDLSWGIFFGLLAAAFLVYSGTRLRLAHVAEPALPGEPPTAVAPQPPPTQEAPTRPAPVPATPGQDAERARRRAERAARRGEEPTTVAPRAPETTRAPARPEIDGGTQLSFDEQE